MKKKQPKKLVLAKETVKRLETTELSKAAGATGTTAFPTFLGASCLAKCP